MRDPFKPKKTTASAGSHVWSRSFGGSVQHIAYLSSVITNRGNLDTEIWTGGGAEGESFICTWG